jgi:cGMP-dependent protein kinase
VLHLRRATFEQLFGTLEEVTAASRIAALRRVPLLAGLPPDALLALSRELEAVSCADGALVVRQGDQGDAFYMLEAGAVVVLDAQGKEVARLQEGAYFGELALLKDDVRKATVVARGPIALLTMKRASFQRMREVRPQQQLASARAGIDGTPASSCP